MIKREIHLNKFDSFDFKRGSLTSDKKTMNESEKNVILDDLKREKMIKCLIGLLK